MQFVVMCCLKENKKIAERKKKKSQGKKTLFGGQTQEGPKTIGKILGLFCG